MLLGRARELEAIRAAIHGASEGRGAVLALQGPAGIGKTSLARAAADAAAAGGLRCLMAGGHEGETGLTFGVVRQLLERPLSRDVELRMSVLTGSAAFAEAALFPETLPHAGSSGSRSDPFVVLHGLYWACSNLCDHGPLVLVVDDLHWADAASVRFLDYLSHRIADLPALLIVAYRTDEPAASRNPAEVTGGSDALVIDVGPLPQADGAALVRSQLGEGAADDFCRACHEAAGGNPFLLRELVRSASEAGIAPTSESVDHVAQLTPAAVLRSLEARLSRLPADARALAVALAVVGPQSDPGLAAVVAGLPADRARAAADVLAAAGLVGGTGQLDLVHPLIRTVIYRQLGPGERVEAHLVAADAVAAAGGPREPAAIHLLEVPAAGDSARVSVLLEAGDEAMRRGAPDAAIHYLLRALDEPPLRSERGTVLFDLGRAEAMLAARDSLDHLAEAVELATGLDDQVAILRETAYTMAANFGLIEDAYETIGKARELARGADPELQLRLHAEQATFGVLHDETPLPLMLADLEVDRGEVVAGTPGERAILALLSWCRMGTGRPLREVRPAAVAALADGRLLRDLGAASLTAGVASWTLAMCMCREELEPLLPVLVGTARDARTRHGIGIHTYSAGQLAHLCGNLHDAEAFQQESLEVLLGVGSIGAAMALAEYVDILRNLGDVEAAWEELGSRGYLGELPHFWPWATLQLSRGRVRVARGDAEGGLRDIEAAASRYRDWGVVSPALAPWRPAAAEARLRLADTDGAAALLHEEIEVARTAELDFAVGRALRLLGRCEDQPRRIERLREAVEVLHGTDARLELAHALIDLGAALRRANRCGSDALLEEAREHLRNGVDIAHRCGAAGLVRTGQVELRATGARPRRLLVSGPQALTASERRVAQMAAEGMTNREIGEALFVTLKTVEKHLSNSYSKLAIESRRELAAALESSEEVPVAGAPA